MHTNTPQGAYALALAIVIYAAGDAIGAVHEGQFSLFVTAPGSLPLEVPFTGTFSFDDSLFVRGIDDEGMRYRAPIQSATITGGDSEEGCCYLLDDPTSAEVQYFADGHPHSVSLSFRNVALNSGIVLSEHGLQWSQGIFRPNSNSGRRGGIYTLSAPNLHVFEVIPEPSTWAMFALGTLCLGWASRSRLAAQQPPLLAMSVDEESGFT